MTAVPAHLANVSIEGLLELAGFGHRRTSASSATYRHEVFRQADGQVVGEMSAHEAADFALARLSSVDAEQGTK